jgi:hypothetical protein
LEVDVANEAVTPTVEKSCHMAQEPIQMFKQGGTPKRIVTHQLYHIMESGSLCPKGLEQELLLFGGFHVQPQGGMVRAMRGEGM